MSQRYFLTTESTYEALRLAVDADLGYPTASSIFTPALQAPRDSLRRIVLAVDQSLPGYGAVNARVTPLLSNSSVQELTEAEYLAFLSCVPTTTDAIPFSQVTDTITFTNFNTTAGSLATALSGIDSALTGKAGTGDLVYVAGAGSRSVKPAGADVTVGNYSVVLSGDPQSASGNSSVICGGSGNSIAGDYSSVMGGTGNYGGEYDNVHLIGSHITAAASDYTLVNNLHIVGAWNGSALAGGVLKFADGTTMSTAGAAVSHAHSAADVTSGVFDPARIPQFDVLTDTVSSTTYTGRASDGSATSASVWKIRRTVYSSSGAVSSTATATNVKWDDRLTASYS